MRPTLPLAIALVCWTGRVEAQSCLSNPDTAATYSTFIGLQLTAVDSLDVVEAGLPYRPETVGLVTNEPECDAAITSYNARYPSTTVSKSYLFCIQSTAYALVNLTGGNRPRYTFLTSEFVVIYDVMQLD